MGALARFHPDQMHAPVRREPQQLRTRELLAYHHFPACVQTDQMKDRLAEIDADCV
jgi:hypothetical protein